VTLLYAVLNVAEAGDNIVVPAVFAAWGGRGLIHTLLRFGINVRVVETGEAEEFVHATDRRTRAYVAESVSGPELSVFPTAPVAALGRTFGIPLIIDNTAAPQAIRPLADGAAVVVYSGIGAVGGHGTGDGGIVIDGGGFAWDSAPERLPSLNRPDPSYHGTVWTKVVRQWNASAYIASMRGRFLRDFGAAISPFEVVDLLHGVETLPLRARQQADNAARVAAALARHPGVAAVLGPIGGRIAIRLGDPAGAARLVSRLNLIRVSTQGGDLRSSIFEVAPGLLHLWVGLEHADDIVADLTGDDVTKLNNKRDSVK
ncbi:MAG TPA: PLP-dependent transferase, partial [Magnetospirillum sp.]|nr:PLP-dependent transferase [Magnetospirillum sp.]